MWYRCNNYYNSDIFKHELSKTSWNELSNTCSNFLNLENAVNAKNVSLNFIEWLCHLKDFLVPEDNQSG